MASVRNGGVLGCGSTLKPCFCKVLYYRGVYQCLQKVGFHLQLHFPSSELAAVCPTRCLWLLNVLLFVFPGALTEATSCCPLLLVLSSLQIA